jgi:hypothetical protein
MVISAILSVVLLGKPGQAHPARAHPFALNTRAFAATERHP